MIDLEVRFHHRHPNIKPGFAKRRRGTSAADADNSAALSSHSSRPSLSPVTGSVLVESEFRNDEADGRLTANAKVLLEEERRRNAPPRV